ncbi:hypothetical protein TNCV_1984171 [Trichonephila clavipes]|nr:hypothetical protein TNCV_1984171 [Trichonephila clavipes]
MAHNSEQAATSAYVLMIQSLLSPLKEVVHIMPVKKIDGEKLFAVVKKLSYSLMIQSRIRKRPLVCLRSFDYGRVIRKQRVVGDLCACTPPRLPSHVSRKSLVNFISATGGLLATDHVILNHGQVTWTTPELAPPSPNYHTTPTGGRFSSRQI